MTFFKGIVCAILDNKYTLDTAEGAIKNRQSRETGNIEYTRHRTNKR